MHRYDYSFLENGMLPTRFVNITAQIYSLEASAANRKSNYSQVFTELESIAKVQSVKNSNAIEGIITSDERIHQIVNQESAPLNHDEQEIAGYRDALNLVHINHDNMNICEADILRLHEILMQYTEDSSGGRYKLEDNVILEIDKDGRRRVRFQPVSAEDTPNDLEQLVWAYMDARDNIHINQLLLIPCVILDFLCIHPFKDGNGRISRLLTLLLMYKNGFDAGKYISFEEQINKFKANYYAALKESSEGWHENSNSYFPFIENFLSMLYMCYKELDKRFAVVNSGRITKKARIEATVLNSIVPMSKGEIAKILPDVSVSTIESVLGAMVRNGHIKRLGTARSSKYIKI